MLKFHGEYIGNSLDEALKKVNRRHSFREVKKLNDKGKDVDSGEKGAGNGEESNRGGNAAHPTSW